MKNILLSLAVCLTVQGYASDDTAKALLQQAQDLYDQREDAAKAEQAKTLLDQALVEAQDTDLKYDILILKSRSLYYMGMHTFVPDESKQKEARLKLFEAAYKTAEEASKLSDDYAEGYYFYAVALARWGETKGATDSFFRLGELKGKLNETLKRDTRDGRAGEEIDGYGPDRIFGRVYYKLPGPLGGDIDLSLKHLTKAYSKSFEYVINGHYLADTYFAMGRSDYACDVLKAYSSRSAESLDKKRVPETKEELAEIAALKAEKCK